MFLIPTVEPDKDGRPIKKVAQKLSTNQKYTKTKEKESDIDDELSSTTSGNASTMYTMNDQMTHFMKRKEIKQDHTIQLNKNKSLMLYIYMLFICIL